MSSPIDLSKLSHAKAGPSESGARRIVVLDDDPAVLKVVEKILRGAGYEVWTTCSPKEAMERVVCEGADAIISDLHMPEMGGHLVLAMLAQAVPRVGRILLTGETDFMKVASVMVPYSVHGFISKAEVGQRLVPVLRDLFAGRTEEEAEIVSHEARALARSIVRALAMRDYETEAHCERVANWSRRLGEALGLAHERLLDVELGALLHDVGKIGVRDAILLKPAKLTDEEWVEMKKHPDLGVALLQEVPALHRAIPVVQCHHERRDGQGYPRQLVRNAIPLDARIFQFADTYDALTSDRPYRRGCSDEAARAEIAKHVGPQFDPDIHEVFSKIDPEDWRSAILI